MLLEVSSTWITCANTIRDLISFSTSTSAPATVTSMRAEPAGRGPRPGQVGDQRSGARDRDVLEHQQVHRQRAQVRPVHRRRAHPDRRGRGRRRAAAATSFVQPVLDHDRGDGRDVVDLAAHHPRRSRPGQVAATATAGAGNMIDDLVRARGLEQGRPTRAGLFTRAPRAAPTRGTRGRGCGAIRRGRLRGVARVAAQLPFQLRDPLILGRDPRGELRDHPSLRTRSARGAPRVTARTRTPHMISTPHAPGHAATHRRDPWPST